MKYENKIRKIVKFFGSASYSMERIICKIVSILKSSSSLAIACVANVIAEVTVDCVVHWQMVPCLHVYPRTIALAN